MTIRTQIEDYIALRVALGFKFVTTAATLRDYGDFAELRGDTFIRWRTALAWAKRAASDDGRTRRLASVHRLAEFLRAEDARHELVPKHLRRFVRRHPMPHLYSSAEISALLDHAAKLGSRSKSFRAKTFVTLFGLLAATGLRVSEALRLRLSDVSDHSLVIRRTKFQKTREIPIHATTARALADYIAVRRSITAFTDHVFVGEFSGRAVRYADVWWAFRGLCLRAGIGIAAPSGRAPRIHDLRHTFAVRALERCPNGRRAVERHMAALSAYLGHANPRHTFWYLHRSPTLLRHIARACERNAAEARAR